MSEGKTLISHKNCEIFKRDVMLRDTPIQPKTGSYMKARPKGYRSRETQKIMAENTEAYLTPEDIPCSSVRNGEDISKWTIPQLKFWLKCRRLNQQGLKIRSCRKESFVT